MTRSNWQYLQNCARHITFAKCGIDNHYSIPAQRGLTRRLPLHELPRNIDAESHMAELDPQDIPVGSQTQEAAGTQIVVRRTSGIVEEWLDDDWWEELESTAENEIPQAAEGEGHAERDNPLRDAEDWSQEHHLELDEAQAQPTRSGDTVWRSVSGIDVHPPGSDVNEDESAVLLRPAFAEDSGIRMAYLQAAIANVFMHVSVINATSILNTTLNILDAAGTLPLHPRPVRTLESAKRRLGIDADQHITQYTICPICWKHYTPKQVQESESPQCLVFGCVGTIFDEYRDYKGQRKRKPRKVNPYTSLIHTLRRFFVRPGFSKLIRDNRLPENQVWHNGDEDFVMDDIYHGSRWNECLSHTRREIGNLGTVRDVPLQGGEPKRLNSHRYGLHLTVNTDWYVFTLFCTAVLPVPCVDVVIPLRFQMLQNRPHSTGPVYITINDLPRDHRFLKVNVICPCVMPGPGEPDAIQLNHVLEPLAYELIQLKSGVT
jgi:hypothetical protein